MSPQEIAHRAVEQTKRVADATRHWCWADFGNFDGPLSGLPGLFLSRTERLRTAIGEEAARIRERRIQLLNREWPWTPDWDSIWQLDPVTGTHWPGDGTFAFRCAYRHARDKGDVKYVWEVNRLQFLPVLALAKDHEVFTQVLESWMEKNPPFQGINWASGIEAASRVVSLLAAQAFLSADVQTRLDRRIRSFLEAHLYWIRRYPSLHSSANNHRAAELTALFVASLCAPGLPQAEQTMTESRNGLEDRMMDLFHTDGVGAEQSVTYAAYALEWLALAGVAAQAHGQRFNESYQSRAGAAAEHLCWLMDDAARIPAIGDGDETRVLALKQDPEERYPASVVALVARWLGRPELSPPATDPHIRDLWGAADIAPAQASPVGMRVFDAGGITVIRDRTACGTLVCVFDHGPLGFESIAAHGHADALSIWLSWGDEPIFVDAGTYLYHSGGEWRDHFRTTPVHNTLSLENGSQSAIAGPFNWSRHACARIVARTDSSITAEHDGYRRAFGAIHRRVLARASCNFVLSDFLSGTPRRAGLRWQIGFTLAPIIRVGQAGEALTLTTPKGRILRIVVEEGPGLAVSRIPYSPAFGQMAETGSLVLSGVFKGGTECVARLRLEAACDA